MRETASVARMKPCGVRVYDGAVIPELIYRLLVPKPELGNQQNPYRDTKHRECALLTLGHVFWLKDSEENIH